MQGWGFSSEIDRLPGRQNALIQSPLLPPAKKERKKNDLLEM